MEDGCSTGRYVAIGQATQVLYLEVKAGNQWLDLSPPQQSSEFSHANPSIFLFLDEQKGHTPGLTNIAGWNPWTKLWRWTFPAWKWGHFLASYVRKYQRVCYPVFGDYNKPLESLEGSLWNNQRVCPISKQFSGFGKSWEFRQALMLQKVLRPCAC